jgi:hypothetical protein
MRSRAWGTAALVVSLAALFSAVALDRFAPFPSADVARGSEEAFASGLEPRELEGPLRVPARWTGARAHVRFRNVPPGPRSLEVTAHQQRGPLVVAVDGVILGPAVGTVTRFPLSPSRRSSVSVELQATTFKAGSGRVLGVRFDRVTLHHERGAAPPLGLLAAGLGIGLGVLAFAGASGLAPWIAVLMALLALLVDVALLWPMGLLRSDYSLRLPLLALAGAALACGFARWRRQPLAFVALLVGWLLQAVVLTSPMVVTSDAVMHANFLNQVAHGDLFPVSRTQNAPPIEFPYGVSFYALLAPLARLGFDPVTLVRYAAGIAGALSAVALFLICEPRSARAALAVALLQLFPVTSDLLSYGNLSNVFSQTLTLAFLAWWRTPGGGAVVGASLLLLAALSHLSSVVVLAVLVPLLWAFVGRGRVRLLAVVAAALLSALYYSHFAPLILKQLPRLLEGASAGGRSLGLVAAVTRQLQEALARWAIPATLLAAAGLLRPSPDELRPLLKTAGVAAAVLAVVGSVSPVEVRYVYAVAFAVAILAADGATKSFALGVPGRLAAAGLLAWQIVLALTGIQEILLSRYRL